MRQTSVHIPFFVCMITKRDSLGLQNGVVIHVKNGGSQPVVSFSLR